MENILDIIFCAIMAVAGVVLATGMVVSFNRDYQFAVRFHRYGELFGSAVLFIIGMLVATICGGMCVALMTKAGISFGLLK